MTIAADPAGPADPAEAVAAAVGNIASVARLGGGTVIQTATFLPGRRVAGVRLGAGVAEVHVTARYGASLPDLAAEVRDVVAPLAPGHRVDVYVDDLEIPAADEPTAPVAELTAVIPTALPPAPADR